METNIKSIDSTLIIAIISSFLYCSGTVYTHGYLDAIGLDTDLMDREFHQIIYQGLILNILSMIVIIPALMFLFVSLHGIYVVEFSKNSKVVAFKKILGIPTREHKPIEKKYKQRSRLFLYIFIGSIAFFVFMTYFEKQGVSKAKKVLQCIQSKSYNTIYFKNQKPLAFLYCGSKNCAGLDVETGEYKYFPNNMVLSYKKTEKTCEGKDIQVVQSIQ